jgi:glycosyltransferase involved in cell wall biosynthesis
MKRPAILVVTGAYYPELSGGGLQARELIRALRDRAGFVVLTTASSRRHPAVVDGTRVHRVRVDLRRLHSRVRGLGRFVWLLARLARRSDIVHLQGVSRKNVIVTAVAKLLGKRIVLSLRTGVHDDPVVVRSNSRLRFWSIAQADTVLAVSAALRDAAVRAGLPPDRVVCLPNGVDTVRFRPPAPGERDVLRRRLGLPAEATLVLFVGFFSHDKGPRRLFAAWNRLPTALRERTRVLFIGQTRRPHPEVDPALVEAIRADADGGPSPLFVERTHEIECYYRAADLFILPSVREGCPNALLEAMATGLPVISTRLPGSTDALVVDGVTGRLVPPGDVDALGVALAEVLSDRTAMARYGTAARDVMCRRFSIDAAAAGYLEVYRALTLA